jgi:hypothetical protein
MDSSTDKSTVNLVVLLLGIGSIVGLAGLIWLIYEGTDANALLAISSPVALMVGALAAVLSSTRSVDTGGLTRLAESQAAQRLEADLARLDNGGDYGQDVTPGTTNIYQVEVAAVPDEQPLV